MQKKRLLSLLLMVCLINFSLTGCGTSIAERKADTSSTLYVGHVGTSFPKSFMPWLSREGIAPTVASMLYNTLFSYDEETGNYQPLIGKQWCYVDLEGKPLTVDGTFDGEIDYQEVDEYYNAVKRIYEDYKEHDNKNKSLLDSVHEYIDNNEQKILHEIKGAIEF